ncbi:phosphatidylinositol-specific phospholipase C domain-containing protein, partial [Paracoccus liaowanqingii]
MPKITKIRLLFIKLLFNLSICLFLLFFNSINSFAEEFHNQNWMSQIADETAISELSIPGTHESACTKGVKVPIWGKDYGKCQNGPYQTVITDQLNMGVRFLDIRCRYIDEQTFSIHHGDLYQNFMFGDVINSCANFLNNYPS